MSNKNFTYSNSDYKLVWEDNFDGNELDKNKWVFCDGMGFKPDMPALTTSDVVRVEDGLLKIEAIKYSDPNDKNVKYATNISLTTASTMNYKYGYLEMRAKVPFKVGAWPSFWLKGVNEVRWQDAVLASTDLEMMPEVDIFEVFGSTDTLLSNLHKWRYDRGDGEVYHTALDFLDYNRKYTFDDTENLSDEFHIYGFEWTPEEMIFYVDGKEFFKYDLSVNFDETGRNTGMDCFHVPMYILFNNYLYTPMGDYGPTPTIKDEDLPSKYHIDWIRLYQKLGVGELYTAK